MDIDNLEIWTLGAFFGFTVGVLVSYYVEKSLRKKFEKKRENYTY